MRNGTLEGTANPAYEGTSLNGVDIYRIQRCMDSEMERVARATGGIFIDMARDIELSQDDFFDFNHVNPTGAAKVGQFLYARLKDLPLHARDLSEDSPRKPGNS